MIKTLNDRMMGTSPGVVVDVHAMHMEQVRAREVQKKGPDGSVLERKFEPGPAATEDDKARIARGEAIMTVAEMSAAGIAHTTDAAVEEVRAKTFPGGTPDADKAGSPVMEETANARKVAEQTQDVAYVEGSEDAVDLLSSEALPAGRRSRRVP